jgi:hypothetical protein
VTLNKSHNLNLPEPLSHREESQVTWRCESESPLPTEGVAVAVHEGCPQAAVGFLRATCPGHRKDLESDRGPAAGSVHRLPDRQTNKQDTMGEAWTPAERGRPW